MDINPRLFYAGYSLYSTEMSTEKQIFETGSAEVKVEIPPDAPEATTEEVAEKPKPQRKKRQMSDEQKAKLVERLAKARAAKVAKREALNKGKQTPPKETQTEVKKEVAQVKREIKKTEKGSDEHSELLTQLKMLNETMASLKQAGANLQKKSSQAQPAQAKAVPAKPQESAPSTPVAAPAPPAPEPVQVAVWSRKRGHHIL